MERIWIPAHGKNDQPTKGEVICFHQRGPWGITVPAGRGRGFVVTHIPSGAFALPFGKGGDLDYDTAKEVVEQLAKKVPHQKDLSDNSVRQVLEIVESYNGLRWET